MFFILAESQIRGIGGGLCLTLIRSNQGLVWLLLFRKPNGAIPRITLGIRRDQNS
jgi:hypothetical protein